MKSFKTQKYDLVLSDSISVDAEDGKKIQLARIKALKSFGNVKAGDVGGYIDNMSCLSQEDNCWIYDNARVYNGAKVRNQALVMDDAIINASNVLDNAMVCENAEIYRATVNKTATIAGNVIVKNSLVTAEAWLKGNIFIDADIAIAYSSEIVTLYPNLDIRPLTLCPKHNYINTERFNGSVFEFQKRVSEDPSFNHYKEIVQ